MEARLDTREDGSVALALTPRASMAFALPDTLGAVQVTAELNQDDFKGTVSLLYHVQNTQNYDFLCVGVDAVRQGRVSGGRVGHG